MTHPIQSTIAIAVGIVIGLAHQIPIHAKECILPRYEVVTENLVNDHNQQVVELLTRKEYEAAALTAQFAIATGESVLGITHPSIVTSYHHLSQAYRGSKQYDKAEATLLKLIQATEAKFSQESRNLIPTLHDLGDLYFEQGQYDKAETVYLRALSLLEKTSAKTYLSEIAPLEKLIAIYTAQGHSSKAQQFTQRLNTLRQQFYPSK